MARNGSGVQSSPAADYPAVADTLITATHFNNVIDDINTGLTGSVAADGQTTITANIPMNSKKFTGVANGSARTDSVTLGQVQDGTLNWVDGGGTADAITATYSPAITALVDGQICCVRATAANATTTPTFAPNGLTARTIVKKGGKALVAGDIEADGHELILRYLLASTRWELMNPASGAFAGAVSGTTLTSTVAIGTAPLTVTSTTEVANLKAATATTATNLSGGTVAATTVAASSSILSSSPTAGIGYATGAGSTVTQITSQTTSVTINAVCGVITGYASPSWSTTTSEFTVSNTSVSAGDVVIVNKGTSGGNDVVCAVSAVSANSFIIQTWATTGAPSSPMTYVFAVIKAVSA